MAKDRFGFDIPDKEKSGLFGISGVIRRKAPLAVVTPEAIRQAAVEAYNSSASEPYQPILRLDARRKPNPYAVAAITVFGLVTVVYAVMSAITATVTVLPEFTAATPVVQSAATSLIHSKAFVMLGYFAIISGFWASLRNQMWVASAQILIGATLIRLPFFARLTGFNIPAPIVTAATPTMVWSADVMTYALIASGLSCMTVAGVLAARFVRMSTPKMVTLDGKPSMRELSLPEAAFGLWQSRFERLGRHDDQDSAEG